MQFLNRYTLQTPESVELEFTLAGLGNRGLAALIDYALWSLTVSILLAILSQADWLISLVFGWLGDTEGIELWFTALLILISFVVYVGYYVLFETLWRGQTPGKRFVKIRAIRDDGRPVGLIQATLRSLLRPIDELPPFYLGAFFIFLGKREKRLGDLLAGTIVIQDEGAIAPASFAVSESSHELAQYLLSTTDISQLLPDDFVVIRDFLQRRSTMRSPSRKEVGLGLARQARTIIHLETIPEGTTSEAFLEAIYLAYQQQPERR
jgi:uncharacterized RDD family membrane protein YckC